MTRPKLSAGPLLLELCPELGGAIARFDFAGQEGSAPVLRPSPKNVRDVLDTAAFPLVPFVNRLRSGHFRFRGRDVRLRPNMEGDPNPLHGQGWRGGWEVEELGDSSARLRFRHRPGGWPWPYEALQHFELDPEGLSIRLECRNLSDEPMPCGLGQHPHFNCGPATRVATKVEHAWTIDKNALPVEKVPAIGRYDLGDRPACGQGLDHGFAGWSGEARITDPDWPFDLRLSSADARFLQFFSPEEGGSFALEPTSHANAALNEPEEEWERLGLRVLEAGETMRLDVRLDVLAKSRKAG